MRFLKKEKTENLVNQKRRKYKMILKVQESLKIKIRKHKKQQNYKETKSWEKFNVR